MRSILPLFAFSIAATAPALAAEVVPLPAFRQIELRGGGEVLIRPAAVQRVTITDGSARSTRLRVVRGDRLEIDACDPSCPRNYRLRIVIDTPGIEAVAVKGGGTIVAAPGLRAQRDLAVAVTGGGRIDARAIAAANVAAAVQGGGEVLVHPRASLAAAVKGGGTIRYRGNPQLAVATAGGGSVRRMD